jgi:nicotinamide phosphoribosyltransferase
MNLLTQTDVYKFGHREQYPPGTEYVSSYLESRGSQMQGWDHLVFFGLQYYLQKYLTTAVTADDVDEFLQVAEAILGRRPADKQLRELVACGYLPISIRALPEGTVTRPQVPLMTIENTRPGFGWFVNYLETLLMKIWSPITVATQGLQYRTLFERFANETCDSADHVPFQMHDFGYRGVSSEESAAIAGAAHLINFVGTDTTAAVMMLAEHYNRGAYNGIGASVPASEHSVMCAWANGTAGLPDDDRDAVENMLRTYPDGIVSIVADTYDLWRVVDDYIGHDFRDLVLARDGKTVVRPDSGDPVSIICGNRHATDLRAQAGVVRLLDKAFGATVNSKGYRVLNPCVGLIYGDGIDYGRTKEILRELRSLGYASSNIIFGSGGRLLNYWSRDTLKMAIKASWCSVNGESRDLQKDPVTGGGKKSKRGLLKVDFVDSEWRVTEQCSREQAAGGELVEVYRDGVVHETTLADVRRRVRASRLSHIE